MIRRALVCLSLLVAVAGCSSRPDVTVKESAAVAASDYPSLAPIQELVASSQEESRAVPAERELAARAAALRARANGLRQRESDS